MLHSRALRVILITMLLGSAGCKDSERKPVEQSRENVRVNPTHFDARLTGTIQGRIIWDGALPIVPRFHGWCPPFAGQPPGEEFDQPNPNAPSIVGEPKSVCGAVVFLRGVNPEVAKPWNHEPVRIEMQNLQFHVFQGKSDSHVGFVRRGESVQMESRDEVFHSLHASGAPDMYGDGPPTFFTLTFPDRDQPLSRTFDKTGVVELTSAVGYFWMRGYLFVADHPYYTRTDATGRFELTGVPAGNYDLVCWLPNWNKSGHDREPESAAVMRIFFHPPAERTQYVILRPEERQNINLTFSLSSFAK